MNHSPVPRAIQGFFYAMGLVPSISVLITSAVTGDIAGDLRELGLPLARCSGELVANSRGELLCAELGRVVLVRTGAFIALAVVAAIPLLLLAVRMAVKRNRAAASLVFPPLVRVILMATIALITAQFLIFLGTAYVLDSHIASEVRFSVIHLFVYVFFFFTAAGTLIRSLGVIPLRFSVRVIGRRLTAADAPDLVALVGEVCRALKVPPPDNIVAGFTSGFFVTASPLELAESAEILKGESLYVPLAFVRLYTRAELKAVIAHEMAHFAGDDPRYGRRFIPAFASLHYALEDIHANYNGSGMDLVYIPIEATITLMLAMLDRTVAEISQDQELRADAIAARLVSPHAAIGALVKAMAMKSLHDDLYIDAYENAKAGKPIANLPLNFDVRAREKLRDTAPEEILADVVEADVAGPADTHPTLLTRAAALGIMRDDIPALLTVETQSPAVADDFTGAEEALSQIAQNQYVQAGWTALPWRR